MVRPKKHLGQHFLTDPAIARRTAEAIPSGARRLLEIGPGTGALTKHLLELPGKALKLAEIDKESVDYLLQEEIVKAEFLIHGDFLKMDLQSIYDQPFWVVGNFPYNISSQILFRAYENAGLVEGLVGMFQKEVAQRIAAGPGSKTYGILSVLLQSLFKVEYLFTVNEGSFFPPPKVKSAVIRITYDPDLVFPGDKGVFTQVVKTAFNQRRKTLRNALKSMLPPGVELPAALTSRRAEQLGIEEFHWLSSIVSGTKMP
jgi:16S rRNA (adenine1518-N6/adenine1519-N6)-dimethyltransferase